MKKTELTPEQLASIDRTYWIQLNEALERLMENPDFKKVILDGYIKEAAARQVSLLADDSMKASGQRPNIMENLIAISSLQNFLEIVIPNMAGTSFFTEQQNNQKFAGKGGR